MLSVVRKGLVRGEVSSIITCFENARLHISEFCQLQQEFEYLTILHFTSRQDVSLVTLECGSLCRLSESHDLRKTRVLLISIFAYTWCFLQHRADSRPIWTGINHSIAGPSFSFRNQILLIELLCSSCVPRTWRIAPHTGFSKTNTGPGLQVTTARK